MTPSRSAHVQLDDVPRALDPVQLHGRVSSAQRRGEGYDVITGVGLLLSSATVRPRCDSVEGGTAHG